MTLKDMSKLYYLKKLIERDTEKLARLEAKLQPGGMDMSGMPHSTSPGNAIENITPIILDLCDRIRKERAQYEAEERNLEAFIDSVDDPQIRLILSYRFVDLLSWLQVARKIGGQNTEDSVKKSCYRFLKKSEKLS